MPGFVAGSFVASGHTNTHSTLVPAAGSNRRWIVGQSIEQSGANVADWEFTSVTMRGETATELMGAWVAADNARGLQLFEFTEAQIQAIEAAGSGDIVFSNSSGPLSAGAYEQTFCFTLEDCVQGAITASKTENQNTAGSPADPLPHEHTISGVLTGQLAVFVAHCSQPDTATWTGATEIGDESAATFATHAAAVVAGSDGDVTAGVSPDGGVSYTTSLIGFAISAPSAPANNDPELDSPISDISVTTNTSGTIADISGNFSDADSDPLTYGVSPALPTGMTLNTSTGVITGNGSITETAAADYTFTADDGQGGTPASDVVNIEVTVAIDQISSIADLTAGTTATLTTDGATDLTAASSITLAIDGGSAITCTAVTASTCTFDVPDDGIQLGKTVSVVLTVDGNASNAFSDTFAPALGAFVTLAVDYANLHPDSPMYGVANYSGLVAGDQVEYNPQTQDSKAVTVSDNGLVTIAGAATDPDHQEVTFALINADDPYSRSNVSTWTIWSPLKPADAVSIDSIVPTKTGATISFSYPGADVDSYEYNIDGGAWAAATSPLTITGQSSSTQYTFNIRPINQQSRGDTTSQQYTTNAASDTTPDAPSLNSITGAALGSTHQSNVQTVTGVDAGQDISISVTGGEWRYSTNGGSTWSNWLTDPGNLRLNYQWQLQGQAHATDYLADTDVTATLDGTVSDTFTITTLADTVDPVITLVGGNVSWPQGTNWVDPGYSATDNADGSVPVTVSGSVDVNTPGVYTLTYSATDAAGNTGTTTRTVTVVADAAPTITLVGGNVTITQGGTFTEPGYSASDAEDGNITADVVVGGDTVDTNTPGVYTITYSVTDSAGNTVQATRTVTVQTAVEVEVDYIPRLLSTDVKEVMLFAGRGNRFRVQISHDGSPVDLSVFTRFELYGLTTDTLNSNTDVGVFDTNDGNGVINIDPGLIPVADLIVPSGPAKTTLIGYTAAEAEGVVLWQPQLSQARVTVNIINA